MNYELKVHQWRDTDGSIDYEKEINCDSIIEIADWANKFSGLNHLPNDVSFPLERCVIAAYQVGYLFDYLKIKEKESRKSYFEEGIASILLHAIAAYEMTGREYIKIDDSFDKSNFSWKILIGEIVLSCKLQTSLLNLSENVFKFQRWILYHHMKRKKRWDEEKFRKSILGITHHSLSIAKLERCNLSKAFQLCMSKIQDGEIKRH